MTYHQPASGRARFARGELRSDLRAPDIRYAAQLYEGCFITSAFVAGIESHVRQYVEQLAPSPIGQVWFVDSRANVWGLPDTAEVTAGPLTEHVKRRLVLDLYPDGVPAVDSELSTAVDRFLIELVDQGAVLKARFVGQSREGSASVLADSQIAGAEEQWLVAFERNTTERIAMVVTGRPDGDHVAVSHVFATTLSPFRHELGQHWLDLAPASAGQPIPFGNLAAILMDARLMGKRLTSQDPLLHAPITACVSQPDAPTSPTPTDNVADALIDSAHPSGTMQEATDPTATEAPGRPLSPPSNPEVGL
ncbi:hypothetical protein OG874_35740 [Nocardia sp. NBC_00565]|uniref:hypothetical protein n=1 Tax=Nocardia sp. NBC_00565 TaxID=2975993 RepID=UPI002E811FD4|nr:hypothetical protein [Nocardia sp. NBC_00565]WUC02044.1 hypothetical protein OG874_35740 [Nocardia sp. NBC_00565]